MSTLSSASDCQKYKVVMRTRLVLQVDGRDCENYLCWSLVDSDYIWGSGNIEARYQAGDINNFLSSNITNTTTQTREKIFPLMKF